MKTTKKAIHLRLLILCLSLLVFSCSSKQDSTISSAKDSPLDSMATIQVSDKAPVGRLSSIAIPTSYDVHLLIDPKQESFSGKTTIHLKLGVASKFIWLHGNKLDVTSVKATLPGGLTVHASYEQVLASGVAKVSFDRIVEAGNLSLTFEHSALFNTQSNALYKDTRDGLHYVASQMQPIATREVFPAFDDPGFKQPFSIQITAPENYVVITNTPETLVEPAEEGFTTRHFLTSKPLPTYLLAFAVGPYDLVKAQDLPANSIRKVPLELRAIAAKGQGKQLKYALDNTNGLLTILEEYFGTPYPYEKLDLIAPISSFGGAMENVGAILYDEYLLLMDENSPIMQRRSYTYIHAHELAHMWFGNLVTPKWWDDAWLNESFASWMEYKTAHQFWPEGEFDRELLNDTLYAMQEDSLASARQIREPVNHNEEINDAFDSITYSKGGGVLAMLESYAGEDKFREGVRLHMQRFEHGNATANDFIQSVSMGSGRKELEPIFKSFIGQPGVPFVETELICDDSNNISLAIKQSRYAPLGSSIDTNQSWMLPVCVSHSEGRDCGIIDKQHNKISLSRETCPEYVHPNAGGNGYYRFSLDNEGFTALINNSSALSAKEALTLIDSIDATFKAGKISATTYIYAINEFANHSAWDVKQLVLQKYRTISDEILDADYTQAAREYGKRLFNAIYKDTKVGNSVGDTMLMPRLQSYLVFSARADELRAPLTKQATEFVANGDPDASGIVMSELSNILTVGVQDLDDEFFDKLSTLAQTTSDPYIRYAASGALARTEKPEQSQQLLSDILAGKYIPNIAEGIIWLQIARKNTANLSFEWLQANFDQVLSILPSYSYASVALYGSAFCSLEKANQWEKFIESKSSQLPGYERPLAQTIEKIELCATLKQEKSDELAMAIADVSD